MRYTVRTVYRNDLGFEGAETDLADTLVVGSFDSLSEAVRRAEATRARLEVELEDSVTASVEILDSSHHEPGFGTEPGGVIVWHKDVPSQA